MSLHLGKTTFRLHPLLPVLWLISCLFGQFESLSGCLLALAIHEAGHLMLARILHLRIVEIELSPIGGFMAVDEAEKLSWSSGVLLSAAGPLFSLAGCFLAPFFQPVGIVFSKSLARASLLLFLFNLLPALPLDGGNILRYFLSLFFPWQRISRFLIFLNGMISASLCFVSFYFALQGSLVFSPLLAGGYLLYAAFQERSQATGRFITALIARREKLDTKRALPVEWIAVSAQMPLIHVLPYLHTRKYHFLQVLSQDGMRPVAVLDEHMLVEMLLASPHDRIAEAMKRQNGKKTNHF